MGKSQTSVLPCWTRYSLVVNHVFNSDLWTLAIFTGCNTTAAF